MSNLRSLLGTQSTSVTGIYSGGVGRLRPGETYYFYQAWPCQTCNDIECTRCHDGNTTDARGRTGVNCWIETQHYNAYIMCCWKAPQGATRLDFELWGAGGGGATACCCAFGVPGGAGAYSRMTVRSGLGSVTAGITSEWKYTLYWFLEHVTVAPAVVPHVVTTQDLTLTVLANLVTFLASPLREVPSKVSVA